MDEEYYSKPDDCLQLNRLLYKNLGNSIYIYGSLSNPLINGKFIFKDDNVTSNHRDYYTIRDGLCFYGKYNEDAFLRVEIGDPHNRKAPFGEKLAALSEVYGALYEKFGNPLVFYTVKDDDEGRLSLQWCFKDKELNLEKFDFDMYFDDAEIERVIPVYGTDKDEKYGLPSELVELVDDDFRKFKKIPKEKVKSLNN